MTADEEISILDQQLNLLLANHPETYATLKITNMAFRACTKQLWKEHGWVVREEELSAIINGNDAQRRDAFLSLLKMHYINAVDILPGIDIIEVVSNSD